MIGRLIGKVAELNEALAIIDVNGVGYEVRCTRSCVDKLLVGETATLVIFTDVREDAIVLYGFVDTLERQVFTLLKLVGGVGSRTANEILSRIDKLDLLRAIGSGDTAKLQQIKGIGRKLSERIILELKEKVSEFALEGRQSGLGVTVIENRPQQDAIEALRSLGFTAKDAERALAKALSSGCRADAGELIREALKFV